MIAQKAKLDLVSDNFHASDNSLAFGNSGIRESIRTMRKAIDIGANILLEGETGVGKSTIARGIANSINSKQFIEVNISSLPETLFEGELFGHVRGAYTGATVSRAGIFESVGTGIVLLDEIGDIPLALQAKILSVVGDRKISKLGTNRVSDFKGVCICATNRDLAAMTEQGLFRKDLYYRINAISIVLPPLRDRKGDIPIIVSKLMERRNASLRPESKKILDAGAMSVIENYSWPGNIRELENCIDAVFVSAKGRIIRADDILLKIPNARTNDADASNVSLDSKEIITHVICDMRLDIGDAAKLLGIPEERLERKIKEYGINTGLDVSKANGIIASLGEDDMRAFEIRHIINILKKNDWHVGMAAKALGISRVTLISKMRKYGIGC